MMRLIPAQQSFHGYKLSVAGLENRLIHQLELAMIQTVAHSLFGGERLLHVGLNFLRKEFKAVAPALLGVIHGGVGMPDQLIDRLAIVGIKADADAR